MTCIADRANAQVFHCSWRELLPTVSAAGRADSLIVDAPYSERTHAGHSSGAADVNDGCERRDLNYGHWTDRDVRDFCEAWTPLTSGWFVSLTDDDLAPVWKAALRSLDWYVFPLVPCTERGGNVRRSGDGPSSCTTFAVIARRRGKRFLGWGTTESHYLVPREPKAVVGGKPLSLMRALVRDYSQPGDLIVDPCCGAGTTLVAAQMEGRRSIGCDAMQEHAELAARRVARPVQQPLFAAG